MKKEDKKIEFSFPEPEKEIVYCDDKNNILDYMWLFNNIPWMNHDNKIGKIVFDEPIEVYIIKMDGFATDTSEVRKIECNETEISSMHGFAGNSYGFVFLMNGEKVEYADDYRKIGFSKDEVKDRFVESLEQKVKGLTNQINRTKENIEYIKGL
ncbi:MAG: hypothetical protein ACW98X_26555 [Promethearchaeota archaeon]